MSAIIVKDLGALSGGQRRRVDLGLAIIGQPEMLFLDEPTTGLDPEARRRLWSVIMPVHDLAVLAGWVAGGLLLSFRFFAWDPHRPAHARVVGARTPVRSE